MNADLLASLAGGALSLLFSYLPGLNEAYDRLDPTRKRLAMLGMLLLTSLAVFGLGCTSWGAGLGLDLTCDQPGAQALVRAFILALVSNQSAYAISPRREKPAWMPEGRAG